MGSEASSSYGATGGKLLLLHKHNLLINVIKFYYVPLNTASYDSTNIFLRGELMFKLVTNDIYTITSGTQKEPFYNLMFYVALYVSWTICVHVCCENVVKISLTLFLSMKQ